MISTALDQLRKKSSVSALTNLLPLSGKVIFCVNIDPCATSKHLRHQITAMKFAVKIRDRIIKNSQKNSDLGILQEESTYNQSIWEIEGEIQNLKL
jgi:hypothetical protein